VPASGILDLIPLDRPAVLELVCASVSQNSATQDSAKLEVLNGEGRTVISRRAIYAASPAVAPTYDVVFSGAPESSSGAAAAAVVDGTHVPIPRLVVLPGETVRLTFASDMSVSGVVVTWRDLD